MKRSTALFGVAVTALFLVLGGTQAAAASGASCLGKKATITGSGLIIGTDADGDDTIAGGLGDDRIDASDGNDSVRGDVFGIGVDAVGGGNDVVYGGPGRDLIAGDSFSVGGNAVGGGNDVLYGDSGDDQFTGDARSLGGNATGAGSDRIYAGIGLENVVGDSACHVLPGCVAMGSSGNDYIDLGSDGGGFRRR
jgi:hemolysin type calcium-binding protein